MPGKASHWARWVGLWLFRISRDVIPWTRNALAFAVEGITATPTGAGGGARGTGRTAAAGALRGAMPAGAGAGISMAGTAGGPWVAAGGGGTGSMGGATAAAGAVAGGAGVRAAGAAAGAGRTVAGTGTLGTGAGGAVGFGAAAGDGEGTCAAVGASSAVEDVCRDVAVACEGGVFAVVREGPAALDPAIALAPCVWKMGVGCFPPRAAVFLAGLVAFVGVAGMQWHV